VQKKLSVSSRQEKYKLPSVTESSNSTLPLSDQPLDSPEVQKIKEQEQKMEKWLLGIVAGVILIIIVIALVYSK
jgi:hypothetical protein